MTLTGLSEFVWNFGTEKEKMAATAIKDDFRLKEEEMYESLRILVAEISERIRAELIEALEYCGYLVSEEVGGYTQIFFDNGRFVCIDRDSFTQALDSLKHDYGDGFPQRVITAIEHFDESRRWIGDAVRDQPKSAIARIRRKKSLLVHNHTGFPMIISEQVPYKGEK